MAKPRNKDRYFKKKKQVRKSEEAIYAQAGAVDKHLSDLGFRAKFRSENISNYYDWCDAHGFLASVRKTSKEKREEHTYAREAYADHLLRSKKGEHNTKRIVERIIAGEVDEKSVPLTYRSLHSTLRIKKTRKPFDNRTEYTVDKLRRKKVIDLFSHVSKHADFLEEKSPFGNKQYIDGVMSLALLGDWIRPIQDWIPKTHNSKRQFSSLARHLFAKYDVPVFMDECWFNHASVFHPWFIHIGQGGNIRELDLGEIDYTKKMAHHFLKAPDHYTIKQALRWGQIHGLGGDQRLADVIRGSRIGDNFEHDDFWISVVRFFILHPMLDSHQVAPLIDFIQNQRFTSQRVMVERDVWENRPPPQPNLSMHRRDPEALMRQMEEWHHQLGRATKGGKLIWEPHKKINSFIFEEGMQGKQSWKQWEIRELLSSDELRDEGRRQSNCVASCDRSCHSGSISIWTMDCQTMEGVKKQITIEVSSHNVITQARAKRNVRATAKQATIMAKWAAHNGLTIASYI